MTSRPNTPIGDEIWRQKVDPQSIQLMGENEQEMKAISAEISLVIKEKVKQFNQIRINHGIEDETDLALQQRLDTIENRTYLWVSLVFPELEVTAGASKSKLLRIVNNIPATVESAYERILANSKDLKQTWKLLHIVVGAMRPLKLFEMNLALSIDDSIARFEDVEIEPKITFQRTIRDLCGLFVSVKDSRVYLINQTAKEFLLQAPPSQSLQIPPVSWKHSLNPDDSNYILATIYTLYLSLDIFDDENLDTENLFEQREHLHEQKFALLSYTANYWSDHFSRADQWQKEIWMRSPSMWEPRTKQFRAWFPVHWLGRNSSRSHRPKHFSNIMFAAYLGHELVLQHLLEQEAPDISSRDDHGRTAPFWAAYNGHDSVVRLLLGKLAKLSHMATDLSHSLHVAVLQGHTAVFSVFLERDRCKTHNLYGAWTLLQRAALGDQGWIAEKLLMAKLDTKWFEAEVSDVEVALYLAAAKNHDNVMTVLLAAASSMFKEIPVNLDKGYMNGEPPLYHAVASGHDRIASKLLKEGADIEARALNGWTETTFGTGETALFAAVYDSNDSMISFLLKAGADLEARNFYGETVLYQAVGNVTATWTQRLLSEGADEKAKTSKGDTPPDRVKGRAAGTRLRQ